MELNAIDRQGGGWKARDDRGKFSKNTDRRGGGGGSRMKISADENKFCIEKNFVSFAKNLTTRRGSVGTVTNL